jgi:hypothetical protein
LLTAGLVGFLFTGLSRLELIATLGPVVLSGVIYAVLERRHARAIRLKLASVAPTQEAPIP